MPSKNLDSRYLRAKTAEYQKPFAPKGGRVCYLFRLGPFPLMPTPAVAPSLPEHHRLPTHGSVSGSERSKRQGTLNIGVAILAIHPMIGACSRVRSWAGSSKHGRRSVRLPLTPASISPIQLPDIRNRPDWCSRRKILPWSHDAKTSSPDFNLRL